MDKSKLKNVEQEKYIGVIIKKRLSWLPYAKMISCRANLKRQFCKEILEHVIDIFNFNVTRPMLDLLLNTHLQFGIPTIKNVIQKVGSVQRKAARFSLNDYNKDSSVSKMINKLNLDSTELRRKVKKLKLMHSIALQKTFLSNAIYLSIYLSI